MRTKIFLLLTMFLPLTAISKTMKMNITINGRTLTATLVENSSTAALVEHLKKGEMTISMRDYANFEKVGNLPRSFPTNDESITTEPGDIILYLGNQITIYYDTNSWTFTRLGHIDNMTQQELKQLLGKGSIVATFSLPDVTAIKTAKTSKAAGQQAYTPDGKPISGKTKGIVIRNGKKVLE